MLRLTRVSVLLILAVGIFLGSESLRGSWHFDDFYTIVRNDALRSPGSVFTAIYDPSLFSADPSRVMYRPVLVISYVLNYLLLGEGVRGFLLINLLLHVCNALLVWSLSRELLGEGKDFGALAAGLIYAAHPAATEGFAYVSSRSALLATTFTLGSFLAYIRWYRSGSGGVPLAKPEGLASARASFALPVAPALLFVLGLGAKAIAIILPAALIMYHLWFPGEEGVDKTSGLSPLSKGWKRAAGGIGVMAALSVGYVFLRRLILGVVLAESLVRPLGENLLTQARAYLHYMRLFLWPLHQSINPYFETFSEFSDRQVMASLLVLVGLLLLSLLLWRRSSRSTRVVSFGLLWLLIGFLPESSIVPLNLVVSERRMILPLVGYSILAGALVVKARAGWRAVVTAVLVAGMLSLSMARLREWRTELGVWRAAVRVDPNWGLLWNNVGLIHLDQPDTLRAMLSFEMSIRHDPSFKEAYLNLGHLYNQSGKLDVAEAYYIDALNLDADYTKAAVHLAQIWDRTGRGIDARRFMEEYVLVNPACRAFYLLGVFSEEDGDHVGAGGWYRKAVSAGPLDPLPRLALGRLLAASGKREEAIEHLGRFLELHRRDDASRQEAMRLLRNLSSPENQGTRSIFKRKWSCPLISPWTGRLSTTLLYVRFPASCV